MNILLLANEVFVLRWTATRILLWLLDMFYIRVCIKSNEQVAVLSFCRTVSQRTSNSKGEKRELKKFYADGLVSKDEFAAALRAHHAAVDATKSPQREAAKNSNSA
eukprot:scaffold4929_cov102-Skeletonema_marinoi.AAC.8